MISIRDLHKSYKDPETGNSNTILRIASFDVEKGKHLAIKGSSGSGKTTFLHCLSGMITPDGGKIEINGTDISKLSESARDRFRANNIGYIFQSFNLLDGFTALENVMLGMMFADKGNNKSRAIELLKKVGLGERLYYKPAQLSVGQQQRVCIARAVANNPDILLADEPTGSLDPKNSEEILSLLKEVASDKTLLLVSHEQEVLNQFESVLDLSEINQITYA